MFSRSVADCTQCTRWSHSCFLGAQGGQREGGQREGGQREGGQREGGQREGGQRAGGQRAGVQREGARALDERSYTIPIRIDPYNVRIVSFTADYIRLQSYKARKRRGI